jgi:hypothetical protein
MDRGARVLLGGGVIGLMALTGCTQHPRWTTGVYYPHACNESLTQSADDHYQAAYEVSKHDGKALVDDLDMILLNDRPTRLTRWHDR